MPRQEIRPTESIKIPEIGPSFRRRHREFMRGADIKPGSTILLVPKGDRGDNPIYSVGPETAKVITVVMNPERSEQVVTVLGHFPAYGITDEDRSDPQVEVEDRARITRIHRVSNPEQRRWEIENVNSRFAMDLIEERISTPKK